MSPSVNAKIITGDSQRLEIINADIHGLCDKTALNSTKALQEPKHGHNLMWAVNGENTAGASGPMQNESVIMPTHLEDAQILRDAWTALEEAGEASAASFNSGIPIIFHHIRDDETNLCVPNERLTVDYWHQHPIGAVLASSHLRNPYLRRVASALCETIAQMQRDGLWHDTTIQIMRERTTDPVRYVQFCLPWKIRDSKHNVWPNGEGSYHIQLQPINPLCGIADGLLVDEFDPFGSNSLITALFNYEITLSEDLVENIFPESQDFHSEYCILQLLSGEVRDDRRDGWVKLEGGEWPLFLWDQSSDSPTNCIGRLTHFEEDCPANFWQICETDFTGEDGFEPTFRERIMKDIRYGNEWVLWSHQSKANTVRCGRDSMAFDILAAYADEVLNPASEVDDEWGESSRFVPAFKDKRGVKTIDQSQGTRPYWSDVLRCKICNGQCKVLLKEAPIKVIFDCPHCGESGCIDCTHLQSGVDWPESKTRKVVKSK